VGQAVQLLVFEMKLEPPQVKQTIGLLVEQLAQLEKQSVQLLVPISFT
jgi:spore germination cell wall hydrolase CwlJ-like protein